MYPVAQLSHALPVKPAAQVHTARLLCAEHWPWPPHGSGEHGSATQTWPAHDVPASHVPQEPPQPLSPHA